MSTYVREQVEDIVKTYIKFNRGAFCWSELYDYIKMHVMWLHQNARYVIISKCALYDYIKMHVIWFYQNARYK